MVTRLNGFAVLMVAAMLALAGCGGGGGSTSSGSSGGGSSTSSSSGSSTSSSSGSSSGGGTSYTVSATVSGLNSSGLDLQLNGANDLKVGANGTVTFSPTLTTGASYAVTVATQPAGETCTVTNGTGTIASSNVTNPTVSCAPNSTAQYTVSVSITGLASSTTLVLKINGGSQLAVTSNGTSTFSTQFGTGETFAVAVGSQPAPPPQQTCTVANGSGTIGTANVTNVTVACITSYSVGVSVANLVGTGLVLQLNGAGNLTVAPPGGSALATGTFSTSLPSGASYAITIAQQPTAPSQTCTVTSGTGTMGSAGITVSVVCPLVYSVTSKGEWTALLLNAGPLPTGIPVLAFPSARYASATWTDATGNLWIFGGGEVDSPAEPLGISPGNDLWKYNPGNGTWTLIGGTGGASYGTQGVPSPTNLPTPRAPASFWTDPSGGNLWLFGGNGNSDLWKYNIASGYWVWVSGPDTPYSQGSYGAQGAPATTNVPAGRDYSSSWIDSAGNLWLFGGLSYDSHTGDSNGWLNDLWEYSPGTGLWVWVAGSVAGTQGTGAAGIYGVKGVGSNANVPGARSRAVSWVDAAGNLWLFGGNGFDANGAQGALNDLWKYTPSATFGAVGTWTWVAGSNTVSATATYGTLGTASATNIPGSRYAAAGWSDKTGNFWLFGGWGCTATCALSSGSDLNDLWEYNPTAGTWAWMSGSNTVEATAVDGTRGVPASNNTPQAAEGAMSWTDPSGNFWLFGGERYGPTFLSDFWVYTPQ